MKPVCILLISSLLFAVTVPLVHNDAGQTGGNTAETVLTQGNASTVHKLGSWTTSGYIFAQPLFVPAVVTASVSHDLLIVAGLNNTLYAFDANHPGVTIWSQTFGTPRASYPNSVPFAFAYSAPLGILSTPYVDVVNGFIYLCAQDSTPQYTLYKLNLSDGSTVSSVVIAGTVTGTGDSSGGDCVSGSVLSFCALRSFVQRPGIVVANGNVYICFGSTDIPPWHGWIVAYGQATLTRVGIFCTTPNGEGGSIWMSGGAPSVDGSGNLYLTTGNGDWDGTSNFGESVLKLSPTLTLLDWFTPSNFATLNADDADVSSNRFILIPGTTLGVVSSKDYTVYLIDTTCMGHLQGSSGCSLQSFKSNAAGDFSSGATGSYGGVFLNNVLYLQTTAGDAAGTQVGSIYAFSFGGSTFTTTPLATNINTFGFPGANMGGSANGASNGLIVATTSATQSFNAPLAGTLRIMNASTLAQIYSSDTIPGDALGNISKYVQPVIANGRIYVATQSNQVVVFGLVPPPSSSVMNGNATISGNTTIQ